MSMYDIGNRAKAVEAQLRKVKTAEKNNALRKIADDLCEKNFFILQENVKDLTNAEAKNMSAGLLDRLRLTKDRIEQMAEGLKQIADLEDPVGTVSDMKLRPNGLMIGKKRVPLGVVGIIYESRPNVTADAFGLCFKTGNVVVLKGGSDAIHSNIAIVNCIRDSLESLGLNPDFIQIITDTDRAATTEFMKMNQFIDVLIPRGGAGLIKSVVENATIPVIETGTGNCHVFVDSSADLNMAVDIIMNAKTQRVGVCNACESLLIHKDVADAIMPVIATKLQEKNVEIVADSTLIELADGILPATEEDWGKEYLDYKISMKTVESIDEAIEHINKYNTGHSECIVTNDYNHAQQFLDEIDAAAVYVNASTRFTDGFEFGFGAEIGISTQKLHARGPMGLEALTTTKYIIYGNGQIRS